MFPVPGLASASLGALFSCLQAPSRTWALACPPGSLVTHTALEFHSLALFFFFFFYALPDSLAWCQGMSLQQQPHTGDDFCLPELQAIERGWGAGSQAREARWGQTGFVLAWAHLHTGGEQQES